jgi:carbonic anhydrase/acetyltransferase-like protein (isoleucine patch superfamily)
MTIEERLATFLDQRPQIEESAYVAKGAVVIGAVSLGHKSSVWHNAVLRGDINTIKIGEGSNVQDGTVIPPRGRLWRKNRQLCHHRSLGHDSRL